MTPTRDSSYAALFTRRNRLSLADCRRMRDCTQTDVADRMGKTQSAISRIERQQDCSVSTLTEFIAATGGELRLIAAYPGVEVEIAVANGRRES